MKKAFGFGVAATMVISGAASADVLYDNPAGSGDAVNQEFGDFPTYSTYLVADVTIGAPGYILTSVSQTMTINPAWAAVTTARLHIFANTGGLPGGGDDPTASAIVNVSYDINTGVLSTVGLSMNVAAGDYWIGITGIGDFGTVGQAFTVGGANVNGQVDSYRNPGGAFNFPAGTGWGSLTDWATLVDINLHIEGDAIPAPGALALLGVAGLVTRRRRRR